MAGIARRAYRADWCHGSSVNCGGAYRPDGKRGNKRSHGANRPDRSGFYGCRAHRPYGHRLRGPDEQHIHADRHGLSDVYNQLGKYRNGYYGRKPRPHCLYDHADKLR